MDDFEQQVAELERRWATEQRWRGVERTYSAADVLRLRGSVRIEHTLARRGAERLWALLEREEYVAALGALSGGQAVQMVRAGLQAIYLSGWQVAADANLAGHVYPDQSLYPANSVPGARPAPEQRAAAGRPDRVGRAPRRGRAPRLAGADRRRRRGRLRRPPQRLRADAGDDRGRRGRGALRGPARLGEEVRPHGRQGARADRRARADAERRPPRRRRRRRADHRRRPDRLARRDAAHQRRRRARPAASHGRALGRGLLLRAQRARGRDRPRRSPTRPTPT